MLPCTEQLRAKDLRLRLDVARPAVVVCDERNERGAARGRLGRAHGAGPVGPIGRPHAPPPPPAELAPEDPCLITFTSGTAGEPKAVVHAQRYLAGQRAAGRALARRRAPGELVWCTAASGWSKSARNVFIAPWLRGAAALLHDARFDPARAPRDPRRASRSAVLCMAPTEYRVDRQARRAAPRRRCAALVAAGEALDPEALRAWHDATGLWIRDGYGQTETGQITGMPLGVERAAGLDGPRAAGRAAVDRRRRAGRRPGARSRRSSPATSGERAAGRRLAHRRPRARRTTTASCYFEGRTDDVIISAGYRIGPFEVESALVEHAAVAEAAVVARARRGARQRRARGRRAARRLRALRRARARAAGPRQGADRALQVPAHRRLRRRAAEDGQRQGAPRLAARGYPE